VTGITGQLVTGKFWQRYPDCLGAEGHLCNQLQSEFH
jgi:hypothetical protein